MDNSNAEMEGTKEKVNSPSGIVGGPSQSGGEGVRRGERSEGTITKQIERVTSKVPSGTFLTAALGAMGLSAALRFAGRPHYALFVGQWVPTILIMGLYNKLVKVEGSSGQENVEPTSLAVF